MSLFKHKPKIFKDYKPDHQQSSERQHHWTTKLRIFFYSSYIVLNFNFQFYPYIFIYNFFVDQQFSTKPSKWKISEKIKKNALTP